MRMGQGATSSLSTPRSCLLFPSTETEGPTSQVDAPAAYQGQSGLRIHPASQWRVSKELEARSNV